MLAYHRAPRESETGPFKSEKISRAWNKEPLAKYDLKNEEGTWQVMLVEGGWSEMNAISGEVTQLLSFVTEKNLISDMCSQEELFLVVKISKSW